MRWVTRVLDWASSKNSSKLQALWIGILVAVFALFYFFFYHRPEPPPPPKLAASFSASPASGAPPLEVTFDNTSTGPYDESTWDFGDGSPASEANPTHEYEEAGTYTVTLTVRNSATGVSDSATAVDVVDVEPVVPNVVGMSIESAKSTAEDVGMSVEVAKRVFSAEPAGSVLEQQPLSGAPADDGQSILVVAANWPRVPKLTGLSITQAKVLLRVRHLKLGQVRHKENIAEQGTVLSQGVKARTAVAAGTKVRVSIVDPHVCGSPLNPWCFSTAGGSSVIYNPPSHLCYYLNCITSFWSSTNGYVIQCADGEFSHSGGVSGSCSSHGGNGRPLYRP